MAHSEELLSWGDEAALRQRTADDENRPDWMPSKEEIDAYLLDVRGPRILVVGSSDWTDRRSVIGSLKRALKYLGKEAEESTLVHSGTQGISSVASRIGRSLGMNLESAPEHSANHSSDCPRQQPLDGGCWTGRSSCMRTDFSADQEIVDARADILLAFLSEESPQAMATLDSWIARDRPAILCRQDSTDSTVSGEFLNMERWKDLD